MTRVRVLAGTRAGAFLLTSDGDRQRWEVSGPHLAGREVYHLKGSPADADRIYASQSGDGSGQVIQRSLDGGRSWEPVGSDFTYATEPGTHLWHDGTPRPFEFKRIWHLEPSPDDPDVVYAGAEDAAIFRSADGGQSWSELIGLRTHASASSWQPGADGVCLHTIILRGSRMYAAISAAGTFRSDDHGQSWRSVNREPGSGFCAHHLTAAPGQPGTRAMSRDDLGGVYVGTTAGQVYVSSDDGDNWAPVALDLPGVLSVEAQVIQ
jgi:photosystem II stability/assembly factor-like uncharacterized protein